MTQTHLPPSSSIIVTVARLAPITLIGRESWNVRLNSSDSSNTLSSIILTVNEALVPPAGIMTVSGPG